MLPSLPLSVSLAGLSPAEGAPWAGGARGAIAWAAASGFRFVQLDGAGSGVRARELDRSARRDLAGVLKRSGLGLSGIDLWIPAAHFAEAGRVQRAVDATEGVLELAADLARLLGVPSAAMIAVTLPESGDAREQLAAAAERVGARLADHPVAQAAETPEAGASEIRPALGLGIDPAALLLRGRDPGVEATRAGPRLAQARLSDATEIGRVPVGSGVLDPLAYVAGLAAARYTQPLVVDLRGLADQAAGARAALSAFGSA